VFDAKNAPWQLFDHLDQQDYWTQPGLFQQVNRLHNHKLRQTIRAWVDELGPKRILDLFCGSGNLSLGLYKPERQIFGLEFNRPSIACAQVNLEKNQLHQKVDRPQYFSGDAEKHLWKSARAGETFDLVILDPPRQGFFKGMVPLKLCSPKAVIYVSCDPATLARDLSYLCRNDEYQIEKVIGLDFFPQTYHIETVVLLRRSSSVNTPLQC
jgi:23S rRNA (uracil1939-C5)-methyltransferase